MSFAAVVKAAESTGRHPWMCKFKKKYAIA